MRKHGGTPSRREKQVTLAAISPPGVARGSFVGGHKSGLAGCKPPPLFMRGTSSCSSQGRRRGEPWGASPQPSAPTYLPTYLPPRPPARPRPPPTQPSTHHTDRRPRVPHKLRAFPHYRGPARHRAPDKKVHPNGRRNVTSNSTTQSQRSGSTGHHLPGGKPCPARRIRQQQAPDPSHPSAPYNRK